MTDIFPGNVSQYLANLSVTQRAFAQVTGVSTTSATLVDISGLACTLVTTGGDIIALYFGTVADSISTAATSPSIKLDASTEFLGGQLTAPGANYGYLFGAMGLWTSVAAGSHTVKGRWSTNAGTLSAGVLSLLMLELKR